ncbi:MAG: hypothetical protein ACHQVS_01620 [Candidatus Babeliales bacterium]
MKSISIKNALLLLMVAATSSILSSNCSSSSSNCSSSCSTGSGCLNPKTIFVPRSQSVNAARDLVGQQYYINQPFDTTYGCFSITPEFTRSFRPDLITNYFFGPAASDGCVTFSGSTVADRGANDILADYFGMPQDFQSKVCFTPRIENFLVDFFFYAGFGECAKGTYFKLHAPVVYTRWSMDPCEKVISEGTTDYPKGYMTLNGIPRSELATSILPALAGNVTFGDETALQYGKIPCGVLKKTRLSDVQMWLGYNFVNCDYAHFGLNVNGTIPTGNKPNPEFLFAPVVGNGGFYQAGIGITSHARIWQNEEESRSLAVFFDVNIRHSFNTTQLRSFDVTGSAQPALSRYILAANYAPVPLNFNGSVQTGHLNSASLEYDKILQNVINITTVCCDVKVKLDTDTALKFSYTHNKWQADLGYNLWARTAESVSINPLPASTYALKGDAFLYGAGGTFLADAQANYPADAVALGVTEVTSTAFAGNNYHVNNASNFADPTLNVGVDSHTNASAVGFTNVFSPNSTQSIIIHTSQQPTLPLLYSAAAVNTLLVSSATAPSVVTHKLFAHISYNWDTSKDHVHPFLGIGGEAEFDTKRKSVGECTSCDCRSALNQWGVWIKGGVGF